MYGQGVSKVGEIVDLGTELNVLQKSGSWYSYDTTKIGQGRDSVKQMLEDNPELAAEIEGKIRAKYAQAIEVVKTRSRRGRINTPQLIDD
jgi:recombination protein RecA